MKLFILFFLNQFILRIICQKSLLYFNNDELDENDRCSYSENSTGVCKKLIDCKSEFDKYKAGLSDLKVCKYEKSLMNNLICCPVKLKKIQQQDYTNYKFCIDQFLEQRISSKDAFDLARAIADDQFSSEKKDKRNVTDEDCKNVEKYTIIGAGEEHYIKPWELFFWGKKPMEKEFFNNYDNKHNGYHCEKGKVIRVPPITTNLELYGTPVKKGEYTNMAAIGWTQGEEVVFNCGGTILTTRWIISAAHCKFFNKKVADVVRVGDRFLKTIQDDENAQQFKIEKFIHHPEYKSFFKYNDIAMIKTDQEIVFTTFVSHACIPDETKNRKYWSEYEKYEDNAKDIQYRETSELGTAGYGEVKT
jgi:hypothetical protein